MNGVVRNDPRAYLDAIAARLDAEDDTDPELADDVLRAVQRSVGSLLNGTTDPERLDEDWPGFFRLVSGFVLAFGSLRLCRLLDYSSLFEGWGDDTLTDYDRVFLEDLFHELDEVLHRHGPSVDKRTGYREMMRLEELAEQN